MTLFGSSTLDLVALLVSIVTFLYFYFTRNFDFWKNKGVTFIKPLPFFGSFKEVALRKFSIGHYLKNVYDDYKGKPYVGIYAFNNPTLVALDLELVKNVLVKDSQNFLDRLLTVDKDLMPLAARGLFLVKGPKWKYMRNHLSPTFTSGKMKNMFYLVENCAKEMDLYMDAATADGSPVEVKEFMAKFTTDVIASCAFGIDSNTMKNPDAEFRAFLRKNFDPPKGFRLVKMMVMTFAPQILKLLRLTVSNEDMEDFVRKTVWSTVKYRENNSVSRNDFLDLLMDMRKKNKAETGHDKPELDDDDYIAQAITFLNAGFETSSTTMSFAFYELSLQPEIQGKLRAEILQILKKHNQVVTYEAIQEATYLEMVIFETLRKYPVLPFLDRKCLTDYEIPAPSGKGTVKLPAGTGIYIPLMGIHYDPEYYPDPDKFNPERFSEENKAKRPNYTHIPFGDGPRFCVGMRFGLMQVKTGLIHILSRYEVEPCKDTPVPLVLNKKHFLISTKDGIPLSFKKIKK